MTPSRAWYYIDPRDPASGDWEPVEYRKTEQEIVEEFYHSYCQAMSKAGKMDECTYDKCIEDWVIVNWAYQKEEDS